MRIKPEATLNSERSMVDKNENGLLWEGGPAQMSLTFIALYL
jgi:hypothetical protein